MRRFRTCRSVLQKDAFRDYFPFLQNALQDRSLTQERLEDFHLLEKCKIVLSITLITASISLHRRRRTQILADLFRTGCAKQKRISDCKNSHKDGRFSALHIRLKHTSYLLR